MSLMFVLATAVIPFMAIAVSAALYPGFSLYSNALSDLGHSLRSPSAPIFNSALTISSFLLAIQAVIYVWEVDHLLSINLLVTAFFLQLVAVFNEAYGIRFGNIHFVVSALFFVALEFFLISYSFRIKKKWGLIASIVIVIVWTMHFVINEPPGAAIPELISVALFLIAYADLVLRH